MTNTKDNQRAELLRRAMPYIKEASTRYYDGTDGAATRASAASLLKKVEEALATQHPSQSAGEPVAWYTDWPGHRVYAAEPHGWDEPGLHLSGAESIRDAWHPLYTAPPPLTDGDDRRHIICLCPDCTKPRTQPTEATPSEDTQLLDWLEDPKQCSHVKVRRQPNDEILFIGVGQGLREAIRATRNGKGV